MRWLRYIKFKSQMNLNNAKGPQSSAFDLDLDGNIQRIRVSSILTKDYESVVLRIQQKHQTALSELLLNSEAIWKGLNLSSGLIILSGPTGSGKTTLGYALLGEYKKQHGAIICVEDPIETYVDDYVQLQINEAAGINYEVSIKEILRHDPDIIYIGEIRDSMSAHSAIRAALTGHLVITTLHAESTVKAIYRLIDLGVSILELEQVLAFIGNQRLVHCHDHKKILLESLSREELSKFYPTLKNQASFQYKTLLDWLKDYPDYVVIK